MKPNKILLVSPPVTRPPDFSAEVVRVSSFFPLGIAYLHSTLESLGRYEVTAMDALAEDLPEKECVFDSKPALRYGMSDEALVGAIRNAKPDVVGVSCLFAAMQQDAVHVARLAKQAGVPVCVMGGAHAGAAAEDIIRLHSDCVDYVIIGEAERSFPELLNAIENTSGFERVDGLVYKSTDGILRVNPKSTYIHDLDSVPFPSRKALNINNYLSRNQAHSVYRRSPFTQMITSRGCPCKCTFCALGNHWGAKQRMRGVKNVLDEIEYLVKELGIREIHFEDDNLTGDKERACAIFDGIIERGLDITWNVPSGMAVYSLDESVLEKMAQSGCYSVSLAIESGNQQVLSKLMRKPVNLKKVPPLVQAIRRQGMDARGFFILGYPGETKETIKQTVDFAGGLELDWAYFFIASPLPHTKMWDMCVNNGYINPEDFDPLRSFHRSIIRTDEFDPEYLAEVREEAIVRVNFENNPNLRKYDINKAIEAFEDVVHKYPHFDFANYYLGEAYEKAGRKEDALLAWKKALKANPDYELAKKKLSI